MDRSPQQRIALALVLFSCTASTAIARGTPSNFEQQLSDLRQQLDDAELANKAVRLELDEARDTYYSDNWLSHERAESVMALVQDILADSDQRMNLYGDGTMMGWKRRVSYVKCGWHVSA